MRCRYRPNISDRHKSQFFSEIPGLYIEDGTNNFVHDETSRYEANDFYQQIEHVLEEKNRIRNFVISELVARSSLAKALSK